MDFKLYRQRHRVLNNTLQPPRRRRARNTRSTWSYTTSPEHMDFRNYKNSSDLIFIRLTSSNFLHSGPCFSHLDSLSFISLNVSHVDSRHVPFYV